MSDDTKIEFVEDPNHLLLAPQPFNVTFHDKDNKTIGELTENAEGELVFQGDTMESAAVFFDAVIKLNSLKLKAIRAALERLASMEAFELSRAVDKDNPADRELLARIKFAEEELAKL